MRKLLPYILVLQSFWAMAQDSQTKMADRYFAVAAYEKAAEAYEKAIAGGKKDPIVLQKAADSYYFIGKFDKAAPLYKEIVTAKAKAKKPVGSKAKEDPTLFRYAQSLKALGSEAEADKYMRQYLVSVSEEVYKANTEQLTSIKKQGDRFEIKNLAFNTNFSEFAPYVSGKTIYYASPVKESGKKYKWTQQPYLDIFSVQMKENGKIDSIGFPLPGKVNSKFHEGGIAITSDGKTMYFTRNNLNAKGKKREKDSKKVTHMGIYKATWKDNEWTNIEPLSINNVKYSVMHPALNKDNTKLFFSSDMNGTQGSFDIFYINLTKDGKIDRKSKPVNLGNIVNTKNREHFPYVNENEDLYFSSDGHLGYGLLDVFVAKKVNGSYEKPVNLGLPINSNKDDFSLVIDDAGKTGFFSSNRDGGKGDDDIYSFEETQPLDIYYVEGTVVEDITEVAPVVGAVIALYDENDNKLNEITVDETGAFRFDLTPGTYKLVSTHPDFVRAEKIFTVLPNGIFRNEQNIRMKRTVTELLRDPGEPPVIDDNGTLVFDLPEILFDYDKSNIRPDAAVHLDKLVDKLKRYPTVKIEIGSHTDNRGSDGYNERLSNSRAKSTRAYLISKGIDSSRMVSVGYGEKSPKVECDSRECSEAEHQLNRRSEFKITAQ